MAKKMNCSGGKGLRQIFFFICNAVSKARFKETFIITFSGGYCAFILSKLGFLSVSQNQHQNQNLTKTISKPKPKPSKPYQNQYSNTKTTPKPKLQHQNFKTSIGFGACLTGTQTSPG